MLTSVDQRDGYGFFSIVVAHAAWHADRAVSQINLPRRNRSAQSRVDSGDGPRLALGRGQSKCRAPALEAMCLDAEMECVVDGVRPSADTESASIIDLYEHLYERLVKTAFLLTSSATAAEDIVQDAFAAVYGRLDRVNDPSAYLYRVVVNRSKSALRRRAIEMRALQRDAPLIDGVAAAANDTVELLEALDKLPKRQRSALVLRYYAGRDDDEIAALLRCRSATVRSLIHRGIKQLRAQYASADSPEKDD